MEKEDSVPLFKGINLSLSLSLTHAHITMMAETGPEGSTTIRQICSMRRSEVFLAGLMSHMCFEVIWVE